MKGCGPLEPDADDKKPSFGNKKMSKKVAKAKEFGGRGQMGKKG